MNAGMHTCNLQIAVSLLRDVMAGNLTNIDSTARGDPLSLRTYGIGSAGCNMVARSRFPSTAVSTSSADVVRTQADRKLVMTTERLVGLYQTDPKLVSQMPSVLGDDVLSLFDDTDAAFLMSGLGGVTGSVGTCVMGAAAKAKCPLTISAATLPFSAESERRRNFAMKCSQRIMSSVDLSLVFTNDALSSLAPHLPLSKAFDVLNGIMQRPAMEIASVLGTVSVNAFRRAVGSNAHGRFGLGVARGDDRVAKVVEEALSSPWFDFPVAESRAAIVIYSAADPWDKEFVKILDSLRVVVPDAEIVCGSYGDPTLQDRIRLSLVLCTERADVG